MNSVAPIGVDAIADELTAVVLSHAHLDHSGYIPGLYHGGYEGRVYTTKPTIPVIDLLWQDHLHIEGEYHYNYKDYKSARDNIKGFGYETSIKIADGVTIKFLDAGHVLGSASVIVDIDGQLIYYSGDINNQITPFHQAAKTPAEPVDVVLVESTNADREIPRRENVLKEFVKDIKNSFNSGKKVFIPSFAYGRSQEMQIYLIKYLGDLLFSFPVYIDGMINKINRIYEKFLTKAWVSQEVIDLTHDIGEDSPFEFGAFRPVTREHVRGNLGHHRKKLAQSKKPAIVITTSGMMEGGPIHSYLQYGQRTRGDLLAIVGYQVEGTIGSEIMNGERKFDMETPWGERWALNLQNRVKRFGFSGHSGPEGLTDFVLASQPEQVFAIHGAQASMRALDNLLKGTGLRARQFDIDTPHLIAK